MHPAVKCWIGEIVHKISDLGAHLLIRFNERLTIEKNIKDHPFRSSEIYSTLSSPRSSQVEGDVTRTEACAANSLLPPSRDGHHRYCDGTMWRRPVCGPSDDKSDFQTAVGRVVRGMRANSTLEAVRQSQSKVRLNRPCGPASGLVCIFCYRQISR